MNTLVFTKIALLLNFGAPSHLARIETKPAPAPVAGPELDQRAVEALERFEEGWAKVRAATYVFTKRERMRDGTMVFEKAIAKLRSSGSVYVGAILPRKGQEAIYEPRRNPHKVTAHPGRFPDITVNIDPFGGLATKNQHHPITHSGFSYTLKVIRTAVDSAKKEPHGERLIFVGEEVLRGRPVVVVELHAGTRKPRWVKALDNEGLWEFAKRVGMDGYVIFCANPSIDDPHDELEGDKPYQVPPYYAHRSQFMIDKATWFPLRQSMWDEKGRLYEQLEFFDLVVNAKLTDRDFDPDNPAYDF